ncbi:MAG: hypothetical protein DRJ05_13375 [Bacteroidetes bacterium]|nr:MAG: hypothetical protein DRJ05_13375 [Bacteroidota bacterium]
MKKMCERLGKMCERLVFLSERRDFLCERGRILCESWVFLVKTEGGEKGDGAKRRKGEKAMGRKGD